MIPDHHFNRRVEYAIAKVEVLSFFYKNPHSRDTAQGYADRLFLHNQLVESIMDELVELDIVARIETSYHTIYRLKTSYSTFSEYIK